MPSPIISLKNVTVSYPEGNTMLKALDDVSLEIYPEEYIIFFGPSGCGKSTLLYAISGLERRLSGEVMVLGKDLSKVTEQEIVDYHRNSVGMIFQAYYLIPSLSVRANVALPQIFLGTQKEDRIKIAESLLDRFGIVSQKGKLPNQLSGGQQQRVAIARSLVSNPSVLLADEPVGNLDSKSADDVMRLLSELNEKDKKTIIMVTHNPSHLEYAHRVFYMKDGKIVREVKNVDRKQVREETMQPYRLEGLGDMAKLYPHLEEDSLKARLLIRYLMDQIEVEMERHLEQLVKQFVGGGFDRTNFIARLTEPLRWGGIGLYHPHAERLSDEIEAVIGMSQFLKKSFGNFPRKYEEYVKILDRVAAYLSLASEAHLTEEQAERLRNSIKARLEGSLTREGFIDTLDKSIEEGGAGLNVRTAHNMARYLELILVDYTFKPTIHENQ